MYHSRFSFLLNEEWGCTPGKTALFFWLQLCDLRTVFSETEDYESIALLDFAQTTICSQFSNDLPWLSNWYIPVGRPGVVCLCVIAAYA